MAAITTFLRLFVSQIVHICLTFGLKDLGLKGLYGFTYSLCLNSNSICFRCKRNLRTMEHVAWSCRTFCLSPETPKLPSLIAMALQIRVHHLLGPLLQTCHPAVSRHACILIQKAHPPPPALSQVLLRLCPAPLLSALPHHNYPK